MPLQVIVDENGDMRPAVTRELAFHFTDARYPNLYGLPAPAHSNSPPSKLPAETARRDVAIMQNATSAKLVYASTTVSSKAVVGAIIWMAQTPLQRVWLHDSSAPDQADRICAKSEAMHLMSDLIERQIRRPEFQHWQLPLERSLFADKWPLGHDIVKGQMAAATRTMLLDRLFNGAFTLMRRARTQDYYVPHDIGRQLVAYKSCIGDLRRGRPFKTLQARNYGQWLDARFAQVRPDMPPYAETIDATVGYGPTAGMRIAYQRMVLPFAKNDADWILTASVMVASMQPPTSRSGWEDAPSA